MDWLSRILEGVEDAEEIAGKIKSELPKNFIPKEKYNALAQSKRQLEESQDASKAENLRDIVVAAAIKSAAAQRKIKDPEVIRLLLDRSRITLGEDGAVTGFDEQMDALQRERPYLFGADTLAGRTPYAGGDTPPVTREAFAKMGYRERFRLFEENPEAYKSLMGGE